MHKCTITAFLCVFLATTSATSFRSTARACNSTAKYDISFFNGLTSARFGKLIPETGLVFSPLSAVSHSGRLSFLTVRGFASRPVEMIAETGNNAAFLSLARRFRKTGRGVKTVVGAEGPTMPGTTTKLRVAVDCEHSFITVLGMIAPSPDWLVQLSNRNLFNSNTGDFVLWDSGHLIAYDAGVDDGRDFTPPTDLTLDMPTEPKDNIAPLVEDDTDRFEGRVIGKYFIKRVM